MFVFFDSEVLNCSRRITKLTKWCLFPFWTRCIVIVGCNFTNNWHIYIYIYISYTELISVKSFPVCFLWQLHRAQLAHRQSRRSLTNWKTVCVFGTIILLSEIYVHSRVCILIPPHRITLRSYYTYTFYL